MKIFLNILIIISFLLPLAYFNMILFYVGYESYFRDMYWLLNHWTSGEMGWFPIYPTIFGVVCLVMRRYIDDIIWTIEDRRMKYFINNFHCGLQDSEESIYR